MDHFVSPGLLALLSASALYPDAHGLYHWSARNFIIWSRGVTVSTLDSESSDRGSNPRETSQRGSELKFLGAPQQPSPEHDKVRTHQGESLNLCAPTTFLRVS